MHENVRQTTVSLTSTGKSGVRAWDHCWTLDLVLPRSMSIHLWSRGWCDPIADVASRWTYLETFIAYSRVGLLTNTEQFGLEPPLPPW